MSTLGQRIKKLRKVLNLSQKQLAEFFSVTQAYCSMIENDQSDLKSEYLHKLFVTYNVSSDWLVSGKKPIFITKDECWVDIGSRIRAERKKAHKLAVNLSVVLDIETDDLEDIEKGEYIPDPLLLLRIANYLSEKAPYYMFFYLLTGNYIDFTSKILSKEEFLKIIEQYTQMKENLNISDSESSNDILRTIINAKLTGGGLSES